MADVDWNACFFWLFAAITCVFAVAVLFTSNIVRMAFYLVLSLGAVSGLFFLAGAEFVGAMQLMIYVGGTLVLLIFGVMLTAESRFLHLKTAGGDWILAILVGAALLLLLWRTAFMVEDWRAPQAAAAGAVRMESQSTAAVGLALAGVRVDGAPEGTGGGDWIVAILMGAALLLLLWRTAFMVEDWSAPRAAADGVVRMESQSTAAVGLALTGVRVDGEPGGAGGGTRSGYLLPFVIVSVHLLVVLVGAAYLARTKRRADRGVSGQGES